MMSLEACLPPELRGPATTFTTISGGLSGAGVHRVEAGGRTFVLKLSAADEPLAGWRYKLHVRQLAAGAGLAPRVVHVDEARRAVVSDFVVDRSFPALYGDPRTHEAALAQLGRTVRRAHELPPPAEAAPADPRAFLSDVWTTLATQVAVPSFVGDAVRRVLTEEPPASERALVLSHNDVHPANLVHDGEHLLLLDWDVAAPNDPMYDLATIALFFRMDERTSARLLAAYDGAPVAPLPARFTYLRRLVAVLCGANMLLIARRSGHAGATAGETLESTRSLGEFYQRLRSGAVSVATGEGQWEFGLVLVKESIAP